MALSPSSRRLRRIVPIVLVAAALGGGTLSLGPRLVEGIPPGSTQVPPGGTATSLGSPSASPPSASPPSGSLTASPSPAPTTTSVAPSPTATPPDADAQRPGATLARRQALDERLDRLRERAGIPGVSVAIIFPDGTVWLGQSGLADVASGTPVSADTAFAVASVTKTFTAAVVLDLVADDLIELDGRVREYLPDLDLTIDERMTVRQLLDHTSGLRDFFLHPRIDRALLEATDARWTAARALGYVGKPYFPPGRGWHYSNTNYVVLGLLAEAVSGESLADLYRTRFLVPLELRDTVYQPAGPVDGPLATGYRFASGGLAEPAIDLSDGTGLAPFTSVVTAAAAAGAMASSAEDIARWARALYAGAALAPESLGAMLGDIARIEALDPSIPYGLGVQAVELDGRLTYGHSGRLLGFRSVMRHFPAEGITIAVLTNQSRADPSAIARALVRIAIRPIDRCGCSLTD